MRFSVLQSHTATQQWQSFELRMRRRRIERCLLRASVAIEAGVLDDAREAIDEVRRLDPNEPGLEPLTAQLADAENPKPVEHLPPPQKPLPELPLAQVPLAPMPLPACRPRLLRIRLPGIIDSPRRSSCWPAVPPVDGGGRLRSALRPRHCRWQPPRRRWLTSP